MPSETTAEPGHPHGIDFDLICAGPVTAEAMALLRRSQHGRRRLVLRALLELARRDGRSDAEHAWSVLADAEGSDRDVVEDVLMAPAVGLRLARADRRLGAHARGEVLDEQQRPRHAVRARVERLQRAEHLLVGRGPGEPRRQRTGRGQVDDLDVRHHHVGQEGEQLAARLVGPQVERRHVADEFPQRRHGPRVLLDHFHHPQQRGQPFRAPAAHLRDAEQVADRVLVVLDRQVFPEFVAQHPHHQFPPAAIGQRRYPQQGFQQRHQRGSRFSGITPDLVRATRCPRHPRPLGDRDRTSGVHGREIFPAQHQV